MTPPAHRARFTSPRRASRAGGRARTRDAGQRALTRLRLGPATGDDLTRLIYGDAPPKTIHALIGSLRDGGYVIRHDWEGYHLVAEPETQSAVGRATRSPAQAVYALLTTRGNTARHCDCGATATRVALFYQLTADNRTRYLNAMSVCDPCAAAFTDAEQILTMEDAYGMANLPVPSPTQSGRARGGAAPPADCPADGDGGPAAGDCQRGATGCLPWFAGGRHAPAG